MPITRRWQRELNMAAAPHPIPAAGTDGLIFAPDTRELPPPAPVILEDYVRETFDGVVGDAPLPFATQDDARLAIEAALTRRYGRAPTRMESVKIGIAVACEWNRRQYGEEVAARREERERHADWLADYQAGNR